MTNKSLEGVSLVEIRLDDGVFTIGEYSIAGIDRGWDQSPVITTRKKISVTTKRTNTPVGDWFDEHHSKGVAYLLGFAD